MVVVVMDDSAVFGGDVTVTLFSIPIGVGDLLLHGVTGGSGGDVR
jgi:hypothetical protein